MILRCFNKQDIKVFSGTPLTSHIRNSASLPSYKPTPSTEWYPRFTSDLSPPVWPFLPSIWVHLKSHKPDLSLMSKVCCQQTSSNLAEPFWVHHPGTFSTLITPYVLKLSTVSTDIWILEHGFPAQVLCLPPPQSFCRNVAGHADPRWVSTIPLILSIYKHVCVDVFISLWMYVYTVYTCIYVCHVMSCGLVWISNMVSNQKTDTLLLF